MKNTKIVPGYDKDTVCYAQGVIGVGEGENVVATYDSQKSLAKQVIKNQGEESSPFHN